jgi:plastocyanin
MRKFLFVVSLIAFSAAAVAGAEDLTLPAAASIVGGAPFLSDVRAFNTSYTDSLDVTMNYGCFIPTPCTPTIDEVTFSLGPRESRAFNDIVVSQFNTPNSAGGIEFEHSGSGDQLVVTSRLYSTAPVPTVGMFIPGLENSEAHATTVLTSIRNGGANQGFRTNVGVYNREDSAVDVTFRIIDGGAQVGGAVTRNVPGHSGVQVSGIFAAANQAGHVTDNAVIVVSATHEVFSYAAVIDNNTTDPIFVIGAEDQPFQATTPTGPTVTPAGPTVTQTQAANTPTQTPTRTPTPPTATTRIVNVGQGGTNFVDQVSGNSTSTITVGTTIRWVWVGGDTHTTTSGPCPPCNPSPSGPDPWGSPMQSGGAFQHTFNSAGEFPYFCIPHDLGMTGTVVVNP